MSTSAPTSDPLSTHLAPERVQWADPHREHDFQLWLNAQAPLHGLLPDSLRAASADASFRRYLRIDTRDGGTRIIMDAPPDKENCEPFVRVAQLFGQAGLWVPQVLDWQVEQGWMLLDDLGEHTLLHVLDAQHPQRSHLANAALQSHRTGALACEGIAEAGLDACGPQHLDALGGVLGEGSPKAQGLIVRVRENSEQSNLTHTHTVYACGTGSHARET